MKRNKTAFTLIELLIVVAIIAILAAIAVPNFLEAQVRSKVSRNKADMRSIATAIEAYSVDTNKYPPPWEAVAPGKVWGTLTEPPSGPFHSRIGSVITTPIAYMTSLPDDPFRSSEVNPIGTALLPFAKRHIYYNFNYFFSYNNGALAPPANNNFTHCTVLAGAWAMYSVGPDKDEFNRPPGGGYVGQRVYRDYDPTNGTVSLGNVFRTAASGQGLGMDPYFWTTP